jgi:multidrug efflux pump subunit AcrA (membrane-fusion protein)
MRRKKLGCLPMSLWGGSASSRTPVCRAPAAPPFHRQRSARGLARGDEAVTVSRALAGCSRPHLLGSSLLLACSLLTGCEDRSETLPAVAAPPPAVSVVEVAPQDVTPSMQFVGRVAAIGTVDLRARVTGFLERGSSSNSRALFIEGADVKEGDLLYLIEQPPFQAQVAAAKAQVAQAKPNLAEANATLQRVQEAVPSGAVSKQGIRRRRPRRRAKHR